MDKMKKTEDSLGRMRQLGNLKLGEQVGSLVNLYQPWEGALVTGMGSRPRWAPVDPLVCSFLVSTVTIFT